MWRIILFCYLFLFTSTVSAGGYTLFTTHFYSVDNLPEKYLTYRDEWTASITPLVNLAENPATPVSILRKLSAHKLPEVRMAVARNPKTPADILDGYFLSNDVDLKIAVVENPKANKYLDILLQSIDCQLALRMLSRKHLPASAIRTLYGLYENDSLGASGSECAQLKQHGWSKLLSDIAGNPNTPVDILAKMSANPNNGLVAGAICENSAFLDEFLRYAEAGKTDDWIKAYSPNDSHMLGCAVSAESRRRFFQRNTLDKRYVIPAKSAVAVYESDKNGKYGIRFLAENENIPPNLMQEFILGLKGGNSKTIAGGTVSRKTNPVVYYPILKNSALPVSEINAWCKVGKSEILEWLAENPAITDECISILLGDTISSGTIADDVPYSRIEVLRGLAQNPAAPKELYKIILDYGLRKYSESYSESLLPIALFGISRQDVDLQDIADYVLKDSREFIAKRYDGDPVPDQNIFTRRMGKFLAYNLALKKRYRSLDTPEKKEALLLYASASKSQYLRAFVAGNPSAPLSLLKQLLKDRSLLVRLELSGNPKIDKSIVNVLSNEKKLIAINSEEAGYE